MTEDQLLNRFADGDTSDDAFAAAVPALARLARGYLTWFGASPGLLEDLAQEAIVRVYMYRDRRRGGGVASLRGWLRVLCRNLVADSTREGRFGTRSVLADQAQQPDADPDARELLEMCIAGLREPDRTVFRLRYDADWSTASIAELFGWKPRNCELILARARRALARCLRQAGCQFGGGGGP